MTEHPLALFFVGLSLLGLFLAYLASSHYKVKRLLGSALILVVTALCVSSLWPPSSKLKKGLDIAGGSAFTLRIQPNIDTETGQIIPITPVAVDYTIKTIQQRLNALGTANLLIQQQGIDRILVQMPGISEEESRRIRTILEKTAKISLHLVHAQSNSLASDVKDGKQIIPGYKAFDYTPDPSRPEEILPILLRSRPGLDGSQINFAQPDSAQFETVNLRLTSEGGNQMIKFTQNLQPGFSRIAIILDNKVISAPVVQSVPLGRQFTISGLENREEAVQLSTALTNPLKNPIIIEEQRQVSATLGAATVKQGVYAGIVGLGLTALFILFYYRLAGLIALIGLSINVIILFGAMAMFGFNFTLAGIAGIILTIGISIDANVIIYERLREELSVGKSLIVALKNAYEKAFSAIFDANITTLITSIVLFVRANDTIKGFAITLTIGVLASLFCALIVTRVLFWWGQDLNLKNLSLKNWVNSPKFNFLNKQKLCFGLSAIVLLIGVSSLGIKKQSLLGIDFTGGSLIQFQTKQDKLSSEEILAKLKTISLEKTPYVQEEFSPISGHSLSIRCATKDAPTLTKYLRENIPLLAKTQANNPTHYLIESDLTQISASLGKTFFSNSLSAIGLGLFFILIYITLRFEFSFAVGAFSALIHDILIVLGILTLLGVELSLVHVSAILTIAGYSINDTIIVFDRIRENIRNRKGSISTLMNQAINNTLSRTLLTSITTLLVVIVLWLFGGPALKSFSLTLFIGVLVGTYSSIFIASPIVYIWTRIKKTNLREEVAVPVDPTA